MRHFIVHMRRAAYGSAPPLNCGVRRHVMVIALSIALMVVAANCAASIYVGRTSVYALRQKVVQIALIWAVPFLGAALCSYFLYCDRREVERGSPESSDSSITEGEAIRQAMATNQLTGR